MLGTSVLRFGLSLEARCLGTQALAVVQEPCHVLQGQRVVAC